MEDVQNFLRTVLQEKKSECEELAKQFNEDEFYCKIIFDGIICWLPTLPGQLSTQECPTYYPGSNIYSNASKLCTENGTWYPWTNYSQCFSNDEVTIYVPVPPVNSSLIIEYLPVLKVISQIGYGVSLTSLVIAFTFLAALKKLHCPRNMLHLHLFMSFIMRAFVTFLKDSLFEQGIGLKSDFVVNNGSSFFHDQINDNWECKAITSVWQYFIMANYSWILMEGLYIHNLIMFALFSESSSILPYVILGWGMPLVFIISWVVARIKLENNLCWTTNSDSRNFLIIRGPITVSIILNFVLFLNIVRIILVKLKSSVQEETRLYWRWGKSTLVLVPLFGVHYTLFLGMSYSVGINEKVELVWLFSDQFFASFQGFFVAILYFFFNSEVQSELNKKWNKLLYHGRVMDQDHRNKSTLSSSSSAHNLNRACNFFMLCRTFPSRQRSESKASRKTGIRC